MRILTVTSKYRPALGGLELAVQELTARWQAAGHEVVIVTSRHQRRLPAYEQLDGIPVHRLFFTWRLPERPTRLALAKHALLLLLAPLVFLQLLLITRRFSPDVVNLHMAGSPTPYVWLLSRLLGKRLVVSLHGADVQELATMSPFRRRLVRSLLRHATAVTLNSHALLAQAAAILPGLTRKSLVTGNGITHQQLVAYEYQPHRRYIACVARLVPTKGVDVLISAFSMIADYWPNLDLLIAGDGSERERYQQMIAAKGLEQRVRLLGAVCHDQALALMKGAAIQVIPSREEAFGLVALEALDQGQTVIASKVGGLAEILSDVPGVRLVPPDNPTALACALVEARVGDIPLHAGKPRADVLGYYTWERIAALYLDIFGIDCIRPYSPGSASSAAQHAS